MALGFHTWCSSRMGSFGGFGGGRLAFGFCFDRDPAPMIE